MDFKLTYGSDAVEFAIPEKNLAGDHPFIRPRKIEATKEMEDIEGAITRALAWPIASPRLRELVPGKKVALVVSDEFRSGQQEMILKCMLAEIAAGVPKEVVVFCATGSHDPAIYSSRLKAAAEKYAARNNLRHRFIANNCMGGDFFSLGKTSDGNPVEINREFLSCEVRAYGHEGKHHYMNGYSCIDKQVLPGLASAGTISANHKHALNDRLASGGRNVWASRNERRDNPFSVGCSEARKIADRTLLNEKGLVENKTPAVFGLDMISDSKRIYWTAAGNPDRVSLEMTAVCDRMSAFETAPAQHVIISPGGPPACQTIYSTQNCFDMALAGAIKDGGEALIIAPCDGRPDVPDEIRGLAPDEKSKKLFYDNLAMMKTWPVEKSTKWIDENFELYLWKTDRVLKMMNGRRIKLHLFSDLPDELVTNIGFVPVKDVQKWIDDRAAASGGDFRVIDDGNKILVTGRR